MSIEPMNSIYGNFPLLKNPGQITIKPIKIKYVKAPKKLVSKQPMLQQTPVGMANSTTSAKYIPPKKRDKNKRLKM